MKSLVVRFLKDQSGATAIEYGLTVAIITVVQGLVLGSVGGDLAITGNTSNRCCGDIQ